MTAAPDSMLDRCARAVCKSLGWGWDCDVGPGKNTADIARRVAQAVLEEWLAQPASAGMLKASGDIVTHGRTSYEAGAQDRYAAMCAQAKKEIGG